VILDAAWPDEGRRFQAARVAADTASALSAVRCEIDPDTARARAAQRAAAATDPSDAGPAVVGELTARFAPWPGAIDISTDREPDALARRLAVRLGVDVSAE
jgi:predicted kinase